MASYHDSEDFMIDKQLARLPENIDPFFEKDMKFPIAEVQNVKTLTQVGEFSHVKVGDYTMSSPQGKTETVQVVIKDLLQEDPTYALVELALLRKFKSDHIIGFIGAGRASPTGPPSLIMEMMERGTAKSELEKDLMYFQKPVHATDLHFGWKHRLRVAKSAARAMSELHAARVIHRDIKAENMFLSGRGRHLVAKLGDFGLARGIPLKRRGPPRALTPCGTQEFMSPEIILNIEYSFGADVFSFGCTLIELICGKEPGGSFLPRTAQNSFEISLEDIRKYATPGCPDSLILLAEQCLQYEEEHRIVAPDCVEWLEELESDMAQKNAARVPNTAPAKEILDSKSVLSGVSGFSSMIRRKGTKLRFMKNKSKSKGSDTSGSFVGKPPTV